MQKTWTKEEIKQNLLEKDLWLFRGILAIYHRQTEDERQALATKHSNSVGFSGADARFLSAMAQILERGWRLTQRQVFTSRKMMPKYAGQLTKIANKLI